MLSLLYTLTIKPLELAMELIYIVAYRASENPGISIIVLSLFVNILVLPLYRQADTIQRKQRERQKEMQPGIDHIKATFKGDERFYMLQEFYRTKNYRPIQALSGTLPLLLQIPFFIAAYNFLSKLELIAGESFYMIKDLGAEDRLFRFAGRDLNALPIAMTLINLLASVIYMKGFALKEKMQLFITALVFLVLLYHSPSGLVLYWTMNNVFSLFKNIFSRFFMWIAERRRRKKAAKEAAKALEEAGSEAVEASDAKAANAKAAKRARKKRRGFFSEENYSKTVTAIFFCGSTILTLMAGLYIPTTVVADSPQEFVNKWKYVSPLVSIFKALPLSIGIFTIWFGLFYLLAAKRTRLFMAALSASMGLSAIFNFMLFSKGPSTLTENMEYMNADSLLFEVMDYVKNSIGIVLIVVAAFLVFHYKKNILSFLVAIATAALFFISVFNIVKIQGEAGNMKDINVRYGSIPDFAFSKTGKNVIVIMLDRGIGSAVPYIMQDVPGLKEQFDGFVNYRNTITFGSGTNFATPSLFGGYEYTPEELNKRDTELLKDKHNEALLVMPVLFSEAGYNVKVCDPPYANYQYVSDLSIYDGFEGIDACMLDGRFVEEYYPEYFKTSYINEENLDHSRRFFSFSFMRSCPVALQELLYDEGDYNEADARIGTDDSDLLKITFQKRSGPYTGKGYYNEFINAYTSLLKLGDLSSTSESDDGLFILMNNETAHDPMMLEEPDYVPALEINNYQARGRRSYRYYDQGRYMCMDKSSQVASYHSNVAALKQLGIWFDRLRELGVYDNTKIIIVADHGAQENQFKEWLLESPEGRTVDIEWLNPMLMVKDFNSKGYEISDEFMTIGDVVTLATNDVIADPVNPFTGKAINSDPKYAGPQTVFFSGNWKVNKNNGTKFIKDDWWSIEDNIFDTDNWKFLGTW